MTFYTPEQVAHLEEGHGQIAERFDILQDRVVGLRLREPRAREYADHGFARRLGMLRHSLDRVFEVLPPDLDRIPDRDDRAEATAHLQAFLINAFGCCENLAWVWISERGVTRPNGQPLPNMMIGMGQRYEHVRNSFSAGFRDYLATRQEWLDYLTGFRDALAHRISLYVPPHMVTDENAERYRQLGALANRALIARDYAGHARLQAEQSALTHFAPVMTHSLFEPAGTVPFHPQLMADFNTVDEMAHRFLDELELATNREAP